MRKSTIALFTALFVIVALPASASNGAEIITQEGGFSGFRDCAGEHVRGSTTTRIIAHNFTDAAGNHHSHFQFLARGTAEGTETGRTWRIFSHQNEHYFTHEAGPTQISRATIPNQVVWVPSGGSDGPVWIETTIFREVWVDGELVLFETQEAAIQCIG